MSQAPEVFGMDDNVDISKELQETKVLFDSILLTQSGHSGKASGKKTEDTLNEIASDVLSKVCSLQSRCMVDSLHEHSSLVGLTWRPRRRNTPSDMRRA